MTKEIENAVNEATKVDVWGLGANLSHSVLEEDFYKVLKRLTAALEIAIKQRNHFAANCEYLTPFDEAIEPFDKDIIKALRT